MVSSSFNSIGAAGTGHGFIESCCWASNDELISDDGDARLGLGQGCVSWLGVVAGEGSCSSSDVLGGRHGDDGCGFHFMNLLDFNFSSLSSW